MKSTIIKYTLAIGFLLFLIACSVKKDRFINRNFHAVTTEYNVLYNGNIALEKGLVTLKTTYQDNFWDILPIERISGGEAVASKEQTKNQDFEKAEEKAVKAIQKHSMNIGGNEKNPQMDEAYLLLAKARYYDNRFIPSLEALNYILYKYPLSDKIYHAKVWREKVNIRIDNDEIAIRNLKKLLEDKKISGQDLADANAMLTQAYINIQAKDSAIATIKIAKETTKNNDEKARYSFILGQLYESLNHQDSAFAAYESVIQMNRKSPRRYVIQAKIKQAQQFDYKKGDTLVFVKDYTKLLEDRENRPFLDALHHQFGLFYDKQNDNSSAKKQYNKSLKTNSKDKYLVASNYRNTAEIYFRESKYKTAGKYYDSTLVNLNDRTREYRKIKKKRINLDDVIKYETIAQANDSILSVVAMSDLGRKSYYEEYIKKLKIEDETKAKLAAIQAEKEANLAANNNASGGSLLKSDKNNLSDVMKDPVAKPAAGFSDIGGDKNSGFYFYNQVTVAYGKKEFANKWGKRALKDNWRWSSASNTDSNSDLDTKEEDVATEKETKDKATTENPKYTTEFYLEQLPSDQKVLDSLAKDRNFAYYQLGIIYKEKFKEYKIYQIINPAKAEQLKQQIIAEYPNSRYAEIIKNPSIEITDEANPELVYNTLYKKLENNQLREVYNEVDELINRFTGEESVAKFELLKAKVVGRLQGLDEYKKVLNYVALTYPNIEEGKQAENLLTTDIPKLEALTFAKEDATEWKLIFPKKFPLDKEVKNLTDKIENYLKDSKTELLKYSNDIYTLTDNFIVIHGFASKEAANSVLSLLKEYKNYKINDKVFAISTEDYKIVQMKKIFEEWILLNK